MAAHSEPGAASLAAGRGVMQPRPHGRARQAQLQGHLLRRQHLFYRPLFRVRALPKRTETDPARLAAPGCSRLARRSWPAHRVARHDPSSTASSPCCPSSRAVCARLDCPWPRLARLTARDARRSLAQIAWSRSLAHSSNFRGGGEDLVCAATVDVAVAAVSVTQAAPLLVTSEGPTQAGAGPLCGGWGGGSKRKHNEARVTPTLQMEGIRSVFEVSPERLHGGWCRGGNRYSWMMPNTKYL